MPSPERQPRVLIVDDKLEMAEMLADGLSDRGYDARALASGQAALTVLEQESIDALVTDLRMPDLDGLALLEASRRLSATRPVIVMTAFGAIDTAIESIRLGASHYLTKPFKLDELVVFLDRAIDESRVRREAAALRTTLKNRFASANLVAESAAMRGVCDLIERVAPSDTPILLTGETGTGKGVIARTIHTESPRASKPFVSVNCAALPEQLLESELFGHTRGAFTGAVSERAGLFAEADGGTIFLDEIAEMPLALQAKLLHVLESRTVRPVGSSKERAVDFRVIAATHQNLRERAQQGTFRADLLYRLDVVEVVLPPLRARLEDLPRLVEHFLADARARHPKAVVERLAPATLEALLQYRWPGNVRELAHVIERLVLLGRGREAQVSELPLMIQQPPSVEVAGHGLQLNGEILPIRELQRRYAVWALERCGGQRGKTAEVLGIDGKTLAKWLAESQEMQARESRMASHG